MQQWLVFYFTGAAGHSIHLLQTRIRQQIIEGKKIFYKLLRDNDEDVFNPVSSSDKECFEP